MADMGFMPEVTAILDEMPAGGQRLLFSATLDKGIDKLVERYLTDPVTHSTDDAQASVTTMEHHVLLIDPRHKKAITAEVANRGGRTVVFVRTKLGADRVAGSCASRASSRPRCTVASTRARATASSAPSATARLRCSSPPTSPPAASTSTTSASSCRSTRRPTTRTTCTARAAPPAPVTRAPS